MEQLYHSFLLSSILSFELPKDLQHFVEGWLVVVQSLLVAWGVEGGAHPQEFPSLKSVSSRSGAIQKCIDSATRVLACDVLCCEAVRCGLAFKLYQSRLLVGNVSELPCWNLYVPVRKVFFFFARTTHCCLKMIALCDCVLHNIQILHQLTQASYITVISVKTPKQQLLCGIQTVCLPSCMFDTLIVAGRFVSYFLEV